MRQSLRQGQSAGLRGRVWHLGPVTEEAGFLHGRLGYERRVGMDLWEDRAQDFRKAPVDSGAVAPFLIRMADLVMVYQPRKQEIRPASFVAALRAILRVGNGGADWRIESLGGGISFDAWRSTIDVVTRLRFRVENADLPAVPLSGAVAMLVEAGTGLAAVEWRADAGVDTDVPLVRELLDQVAGGVGDIVADGRCAGAAAAERRWNSVLGDESVMTEVELADGGEEAGRDVLLAEFATIEPAG